MLVKLQPPVGFLLEPLLIFAGSSIFDFAAYARIWGGDRRRLLCVLLHRFFLLESAINFVTTSCSGAGTGEIYFVFDLW